MNAPQQPRSLSSVATFLDADDGSSRSTQRDRLIGELQKVIERVPEQTELTNTRRYKVLGLILTLASAGLLNMGFHQGSTGLMLCGGLMSLFFALLTWQHRNAGRHPFMRLTRRQLFVDTLSAPVNLVDVVDIAVEDEGLLTRQKLTLRSVDLLPTHQPGLQLFGNQALAFKTPEPHLRIQSAGLMSAGRRLDREEIVALLNAYWRAACAQYQLDALLRSGTSGPSA